LSCRLAQRHFAAQPGEELTHAAPSW
jgi:hypothetical protein